MEIFENRRICENADDVNITDNVNITENADNVNMSEYLY